MSIQAKKPGDGSTSVTRPFNVALAGQEKRPMRGPQARWTQPA